MLAARERCRRLAHIELIAFPQEGILCDEGTDNRLVKALERGADVVGGMPFAEMIGADGLSRRMLTRPTPSDAVFV